jgi:hypothetical protein
LKDAEEKKKKDEEMKQ